MVPLELPSYQRKENWGASETFYQLVRACAGPSAPPPGSVRAPRAAGARPRCNLLGPTALGFRHRDDVREDHARCWRAWASTCTSSRRWTPRPPDLARLGEADFNVVLYPEIAAAPPRWLQRTLRPADGAQTVPIGVGATRDFMREVAALAGLDAARSLADATVARCPGTRARSTRPTSPASASSSSATPPTPSPRPASPAEELGFTVVGLGTYSREFAREVREAAQRYGVEALITDDYLEVEAQVAELQPELVLGTQMERHIAKRLGIPCAVISAPVHVQDYPGALLAADGLRRRQRAVRHLGASADDGARGAPDHDVPRRFRVPRRCRALAPGRRRHRAARGAGARGGGRGRRADAGAGGRRQRAAVAADAAPAWATEAEAELKKIPFFVRGKARRNTERFARERGVSLITVETLYDAKAHFGR